MIRTGRTITDEDGKPLDVDPESWDSFRKKPVEVKAHQLTHKVIVDTLEGRMIGEPTDWLIQGVAGELYPCKDDIFKKTYDKV